MSYYYDIKDLPHIAALRLCLQEMQPITTLAQRQVFDATAQEFQAAVDQATAELGAIKQSMTSAYAVPQAPQETKPHV